MRLGKRSWLAIGLLCLSLSLAGVATEDTPVSPPADVPAAPPPAPPPPPADAPAPPAAPPADPAPAPPPPEPSLPSPDGSVAPPVPDAQASPASGPPTAPTEIPTPAEMPTPPELPTPAEFPTPRADREGAPRHSPAPKRPVPGSSAPQLPASLGGGGLPASSAGTSDSGTGTSPDGSPATTAAQGATDVPPSQPTGDSAPSAPSASSTTPPPSSPSVAPAGSSVPPESTATPSAPDAATPAAPDSATPAAPDSATPAATAAPAPTAVPAADTSAPTPATTPDTPVDRPDDREGIRKKLERVRRGFAGERDEGLQWDETLRGLSDRELEAERRDEAIPPETRGMVDAEWRRREAVREAQALLTSGKPITADQSRGLQERFAQLSLRHAKDLAEMWESAAGQLADRGPSPVRDIAGQLRAQVVAREEMDRALATGKEPGAPSEKDRQSDKTAKVTRPDADGLLAAMRGAKDPEAALWSYLRSVPPEARAEIGAELDRRVGKSPSSQFSGGEGKKATARELLAPTADEKLLQKAASHLRDWSELREAGSSALQRRLAQQRDERQLDEDIVTFLDGFRKNPEKGLEIISGLKERLEKHRRKEDLARYEKWQAGYDAKSLEEWKTIARQSLTDRTDRIGRMETEIARRETTPELVKTIDRLVREHEKNPTIVTRTSIRTLYDELAWRTRLSSDPDAIAYLGQSLRDVAKLPREADRLAVYERIARAVSGDRKGHARGEDEPERDPKLSATELHRLSEQLRRAGFDEEAIGLTVTALHRRRFEEEGEKLKGASAAASRMRQATDQSEKNAREAGAYLGMLADQAVQGGALVREGETELASALDSLEKARVAKDQEGYAKAVKRVRAARESLVERMEAAERIQGDLSRQSRGAAEAGRESGEQWKEAYYDYLRSPAVQGSADWLARTAESRKEAAAQVTARLSAIAAEQSRLAARLDERREGKEDAISARLIAIDRAALARLNDERAAAERALSELSADEVRSTALRAELEERRDRESAARAGLIPDKRAPLEPPTGRAPEFPAPDAAPLTAAHVLSKLGMKRAAMAAGAIVKPDLAQVAGKDPWRATDPRLAPTLDFTLPGLGDAVTPDGMGTVLFEEGTRKPGFLFDDEDRKRGFVIFPPEMFGKNGDRGKVPVRAFASDKAFNDGWDPEKETLGDWARRTPVAQQALTIARMATSFDRELRAHYETYPSTSLGRVGGTPSAADLFQSARSDLLPLQNVSRKELDKAIDKIIDDRFHPESPSYGQRYKLKAQAKRILEDTVAEAAWFERMSGIARMAGQLATEVSGQAGQKLDGDLEPFRVGLNPILSRLDPNARRQITRQFERDLKFSDWQKNAIRDSYGYTGDVIDFFSGPTSASSQVKAHRDLVARLIGGLPKKEDPADFLQSALGLSREQRQLSQDTGRGGKVHRELAETSTSIVNTTLMVGSLPLGGWGMLAAAALGAGITYDTRRDLGADAGDALKEAGIQFAGDAAGIFTAGLGRAATGRAASYLGKKFLLTEAAGKLVPRNALGRFVYDGGSGVLRRAAGEGAELIGAYGTGAAFGTGSSVTHQLLRDGTVSLADTLDSAQATGEFGLALHGGVKLAGAAGSKLFGKGSLPHGEPPAPERAIDPSKPVVRQLQSPPPGEVIEYDGTTGKWKSSLDESARPPAATDPAQVPRLEGPKPKRVTDPLARDLGGESLARQRRIEAAGDAAETAAREAGEPFPKQLELREAAMRAKADEIAASQKSAVEQRETRRNLEQWLRDESARERGASLWYADRASEKQSEAATLRTEIEGDPEWRRDAVRRILDRATSEAGQLRNQANEAWARRDWAEAGRLEKQSAQRLSEGLADARRARSQTRSPEETARDREARETRDLEWTRNRARENKSTLDALDLSLADEPGSRAARQYLAERRQAIDQMEARARELEAAGDRAGASKLFNQAASESWETFMRAIAKRSSDPGPSEGPRRASASRSSPSSASSSSPSPEAAAQPREAAPTAKTATRFAEPADPALQRLLDPADARQAPSDFDRAGAARVLVDELGLEPDRALKLVDKARPALQAEHEKPVDRARPNVNGPILREKLRGAVEALSGDSVPPELRLDSRAAKRAGLAMLRAGILGRSDPTADATKLPFALPDPLPDATPSAPADATAAGQATGAPSMKSLRDLVRARPLLADHELPPAFFETLERSLRGLPPNANRFGVWTAVADALSRHRPARMIGQAEIDALRDAAVSFREEAAGPLAGATKPPPRAEPPPDTGAPTVASAAPAPESPPAAAPRTKASHPADFDWYTSDRAKKSLSRVPRGGSILEAAAKERRPVLYLLVETEDGRIVLAFTPYVIGAGHAGMSQSIVSDLDWNFLMQGAPRIKRYLGGGEALPELGPDGKAHLAWMNETTGFVSDPKRAALNANDVNEAARIIGSHWPGLVTPGTKLVKFQKDNLATYHYDERLIPFIKPGDNFRHRIVNDLGNVLELSAHTDENRERYAERARNLLVWTDMVARDGLPVADAIARTRAGLEKMAAGALLPTDELKALQASLRQVNDAVNAVKLHPIHSVELRELRGPTREDAPEADAPSPALAERIRAADDPYSTGYRIVRQPHANRDARAQALAGFERLIASPDAELLQRALDWVDSPEKALYLYQNLAALGVRGPPLLRELVARSPYFKSSPLTASGSPLTYSFEVESESPAIASFYKLPGMSDADWFKLPTAEREAKLAKALGWRWKRFAPLGQVAPTASKPPALGGLSHEYFGPTAWEVAHQGFEISQDELIRHLADVMGRLGGRGTAHVHAVTELPRDYDFVPEMSAWMKDANDYFTLKALAEGYLPTKYVRIPENGRDRPRWRLPFDFPFLAASDLPASLDEILANRFKFFQMGVRRGIYGEPADPRFTRVGFELRDTARSIDEWKRQLAGVSRALRGRVWESLDESALAKARASGLTNAIPKQALEQILAGGSPEDRQFAYRLLGGTSRPVGLPFLPYEDGEFYDYAKHQLRKPTDEQKRRLREARDRYVAEIRERARQARLEPGAWDDARLEADSGKLLIDWARAADPASLYSHFAPETEPATGGAAAPGIPDEWWARATAVFSEVAGGDAAKLARNEALKKDLYRIHLIAPAKGTTFSKRELVDKRRQAMAALAKAGVTDPAASKTIANTLIARHVLGEAPTISPEWLAQRIESGKAEADTVHALAKLAKDIPPGSVVHVSGFGHNFYEWLVFLANPRIKVIASEVGSPASPSNLPVQNPRVARNIFHEVSRMNPLLLRELGVSTPEELSAIVDDPSRIEFVTGMQSVKTPADLLVLVNPDGGLPSDAGKAVKPGAPIWAVVDKTESEELPIELGDWRTKQIHRAFAGDITSFGLALDDLASDPESWDPGDSQAPMPGRTNTKPWSIDPLSAVYSAPPGHPHPPASEFPQLEGSPLLVSAPDDGGRLMAPSPTSIELRAPNGTVEKARLPQYLSAIAQRLRLSPEEAYALARNFAAPGARFDEVDWERFFGGGSPSSRAQKMAPDGALGFRAYVDEKGRRFLYLDPEHSLFGAYAAAKRRGVGRNELTADAILELGRDALSWVTSYDPTAKRARTTAVTDDGLPSAGGIPLRPSAKTYDYRSWSNLDSTNALLASYGIHMAPAWNHPELGRPGPWLKMNPAYDPQDEGAPHHPMSQMKRFADDVNALVRSGAPADYVAAYIAQTLLAIHPLHDRSGRTTRLLAQLYHSALREGGSQIFPPEFHSELDYTLPDLVAALARSPRATPPDVVDDEPSLRRRLEALRSLRPRAPPVPVGPIAAPAEAPFGTFTMNAGTLLGPGFVPRADSTAVALRYEQLPESVKLPPGKPFVYMGRKAPDAINARFWGSGDLGSLPLDEALPLIFDSEIKSAFEQGLVHAEPGDYPGALSYYLSQSKPRAITDQGYRSNFWSSTTDAGLAERAFTYRKAAGPYALVYVLDPQQQQGLWINGLYQHLNSDPAIQALLPPGQKFLNENKDEKEWTMRRHLLPRTIVGAMVIREDPQTAIRDPVAYYPNPNYQPYQPYDVARASRALLTPDVASRVTTGIALGKLGPAIDEARKTLPTREARRHAVEAAATRLPGVSAGEAADIARKLFDAGVLDVPSDAKRAEESDRPRGAGTGSPRADSPAKWAPPQFPTQAHPPTKRESENLLAALSLVDMQLSGGTLEPAPYPSILLSPEGSAHSGNRLAVHYAEPASDETARSSGDADEPARVLNLPEAVHEYGHSIFAHNFARWLDARAKGTGLEDGWRAMRAAQAEVKALREKLKTGRAELAVMHRSPGAFTPTEVEKRVSANASLEKSLAEAQSRMSEAQSRAAAAARTRDEAAPLFAEKARNTTWQIAYEELFSDLLAVLAHEDIRYLFTGAAAPKAPRMHEFRTAIPVEGWNETEEHALFAPTRSFIGKYLSHPTFHREHSLILDSTFEAIAEEILSGQWQRTPEALNRSLMERIRAKMDASEVGRQIAEFPTLGRIPNLLTPAELARKAAEAGYSSAHVSTRGPDGVSHAEEIPYHLVPRATPDNMARRHAVIRSLVPELSAADAVDYEGFLSGKPPSPGRLSPDGSAGVRLYVPPDGEPKVYLDPDHSLLGAYDRLEERKVGRVPLRAEDLSYAAQALDWETRYDPATKRAVTALRPPAAVDRAALETIAREVEAMTQADAPPEYVAPYVRKRIQDTRAFGDRSDLMSRALALRYYNVLTGGDHLVFPDAMRDPMAQPLPELVKAVKDARVIPWSSSPRDVAELLAQDAGTVPLRPAESDVGPLRAPNVAPFGTFTLQSASKEPHAISYDRLPSRVKLPPGRQLVYMGRKLPDSIEQGLSGEIDENLRRIFDGALRPAFESGLWHPEPGAYPGDLTSYLAVGKPPPVNGVPYRSNFWSTSASRFIAGDFAFRKAKAPISLVYIVDPGQQDGVFVNSLFELLNEENGFRSANGIAPGQAFTNEFWREQEWTTRERLLPRSLVGAYVIAKENGERVRKALYLNPNYRPAPRVDTARAAKILSSPLHGDLAPDQTGIALGRLGAPMRHALETPDPAEKTAIAKAALAPMIGARVAEDVARALLDGGALGDLPPDATDDDRPRGAHAPRDDVSLRHFLEDQLGLRPSPLPAQVEPTVGDDHAPFGPFALTGTRPGRHDSYPIDYEGVPAELKLPPGGRFTFLGFKMGADTANALTALANRRNAGSPEGLSDQLREIFLREAKPRFEAGRGTNLVSRANLSTYLDYNQGATPDAPKPFRSSSTDLGVARSFGTSNFNAAWSLVLVLDPKEQPGLNINPFFARLGSDRDLKRELGIPGDVSFNNPHPEEEEWTLGKRLLPRTIVGIIVYGRRGENGAKEPLAYFPNPNYQRRSEAR